LGIRADDLTPQGHGISESGETVRLEMTVDLAEPLGTETILYTSVGGQEVLGKMFDPRDVAPGETLTFNLALDKVHLFDAGSGKTVRNA
jgi:multiple sugar transport system ATP-binding protein